VRFRVVQPYGARRGKWSLLSEHASARNAFAAIDALCVMMVWTSCVMML